jgi:hypothetical protein
MVDQNSANDVFRFVQLRPRRTTEEARPIALMDSTPFAKTLAGAPDVTRRAELANRVLIDAVPALGMEVSLGTAIIDFVRRVSDDADATTAYLYQEIPGIADLQHDREAAQRTSRLSDTLLAAYFATTGIPASLDALEAAYRVRFFPDIDEPEPLLAFVRRPLVTTVGGEPKRVPPRTEHAPARRAGPDGDIDERAAFDRAIDELMRFDDPARLDAPEEEAAGRGITPFALSANAVNVLSNPTHRVLSARNMDPRSMTIDAVVMSLEREKWTIPPSKIKWPSPVVTPQPDVTLPPMPGPALISPAGVADLLVVKQQIKRYEGAELAHVENVLIGEKKARSHRQLERSEETFLSETEITGVQETELQTTDRFELNRETAQTIKSDQKVGFDLSLSGKYGPTIDFKSSLSASTSTSTEQSSKNSTRFAKDIVSRSLERITTRVREMRTRTIIRETEETNLHELSNQTQQHVSGVYQFLDKVYETQVFNYGIRLMFDFMIPEPASFLWFVEKNPNIDVDLPPEPKDLRLVCPDASFLTETLALALASEYGADIDPAPAPYQLLTASFKHGEDDASESGQPRSNQHVDITVPAGYRPLRARFHGTAITDENPVVAVTIGSATPRIWQSGSSVNVSGGNRIVHSPQLNIPLETEPHPFSAESKLQVLLVAYETQTYAFEVVVVAQRTTDAMKAWRLSTFEKLRAKYEDRVREYKTEVEQLTAAAEAKAERENRMPFGAPPAMNRKTIATEVKKHCISILTQQWYDAFNATNDAEPPTFNLLDAAAEGSYIRFFEQAFEWDQAQWVFYPYFWSRKDTWIDRFLKQEIDPEFRDFLRAGSARVVAPVRPGFELAVTHFLETGKLWGGEGEPPQINSPLYVSIIDEIRERTGAPKGEIPVGDPWETHVPTALVLVRPKSDLPKWKRVSPDEWTWLPDEA